MRGQFIKVLLAFGAGIAFAVVVGVMQGGGFYRTYSMAVYPLNTSVGVNTFKYDAALSNGCQATNVSQPIEQQQLRCPFWVTP